MAEYAARLKIRVGNTTQDIRIYSTKDDLMDNQKPMRVKLDNTFDGWISTSPLGAPDASALRVRHVGSDAIYAVNTVGIPNHAYAWFETPGKFTFTVPMGIRRIKAILVGGGGGGALRHVDADGPTPAGKDTRFGTLVASGGPPKSGSHSKWPVAVNGYFGERGASAEVTINKLDGYYEFSGGRGYGAPSTGTMYAITGSVGQYIERTIDVVPGSTIECVVGDGAEPRSHYTGSVGKGACGCIYLQWGGSIE